MSVIDNERTNLLANALDRASTACFTVGVATPMAGYLYGVISFAATGRLLACSHGRGLAWHRDCTTFVGKAHSKAIEAMSFSDPMFWFTSLGLPAIIAIGAYIAVRLHERSLKR
jgi:hypothetical protein